MILVAHGKRFRIVAAAAADFARHVHVWKKIHFDAAEAISLAGFAAATLYVEAKAAGSVAALARFRQHGEELTDGPENAGVGCRIRARRAADGRLVDFDDFIDEFDAGDFAVRAKGFARTIKLLR